MRSDSSAVAGSALECVDVLPPPLLVRAPRKKALVPLNTGCPLSRKKFSDSVPRTVWFVSELGVPFFIRSKFEE